MSLIFTSATIRAALARPFVAALLAVIVLAGVAPPARAEDGTITLTTIDDVFARMRAAHTITAIAFALTPNEPFTRELAAAAQRGANVSLALDGEAFGIYVRENAETTAALNAVGVHVHKTPGRSHLKALVLDGTLVLADRNFAKSGYETIVVDSVPGDRFLIERAASGDARSNDHLWMRKDAALLAESRMIASRASSRLSVSTESFAAGTPVFQELLARARRRDDVRLLVAANEYGRRTHAGFAERNAVAQLCEAGIHVKLSANDEKLAIDGDDVFLGSANATRGVEDQIDFGLALRNAALASQLQAQYDGEWADAVPACG